MSQQYSTAARKANAISTSLTCSQSPERGKQQAELLAHVCPQLKPASLWANRFQERLAKWRWPEAGEEWRMKPEKNCINTVGARTPTGKRLQGAWWLASKIWRAKQHAVKAFSLLQTEEGRWMGRVLDFNFILLQKIKALQNQNGCFVKSTIPPSSELSK